MGLKMLLACVALYCALAGGMRPGHAEMAAAKGPVLLTIEGKVPQGTVTFDRAALEALPSRSIVTSTPWTKRPAEFRGPALKDVLAMAGAEGTRIRAAALNDFKAEIPISDVERYGVILALEADGRRLTLRDKGPIWVMYPLDRYPDLIERGVGERLVWQLHKLVVE
jgi:hypothetical protein